MKILSQTGLYYLVKEKSVCFFQSGHLWRNPLIFCFSVLTSVLYAGVGSWPFIERWNHSCDISCEMCKGYAWNSPCPFFYFVCSYHQLRRIKYAQRCWKGSQTVPLLTGHWCKQNTYFDVKHQRIFVIVLCKIWTNPMTISFQCKPKVICFVFVAMRS